MTTVEREGRRTAPALASLHSIVCRTARVPIQTETIYRESDSPKNESAAKIGGGAIGGAIIGEFSAAVKARPSGSIVGARPEAGGGCGRP